MLLWQNVTEMKLSYFSRVASDNRYLFESGRSALYFLLKNLQKTRGVRTILVCRFTCPAVLDAVKQSGLKPIFYDINSELTISVDPLKLIKGMNMHEHEVAFLVQATFGKLSVTGEKISQIENAGFSVIIDLALAQGSSYQGRDLRCFSRQNFTSYECSKATSFGWGGEIFYKEWDDTVFQSYLHNKPIGVIADLRRLIQTFTMTRKPFSENWIVPNLIRQSLILFGFFRRSSSSSSEVCLGKSIGPITRRWLINSWPIVKRRHAFLAEQFCISKSLLSNAFFVPSYKLYDKIISPRVPFFVPVQHKEKVIRAGGVAGVEIGTWFEEYVDGSGKAIFDVDGKNMVCLNLAIAEKITAKKINNFIELCK